MRVSEIFYSIQGEGVSFGLPAVFLRLYGCNLECVWCDSKYAWQGGGFAEMLIDEVLVVILASRGQSGCTRLVVTGGEPLLQEQALVELAQRREMWPWMVEVETNGTIFPLATLIDKGWQFNVSPKLASSGNALDKRYSPDVLHQFHYVRNVWFKFTVATQEDLNEVVSMVQECNLRSGRVILMPEGTDVDTLLERGRWLVEACKKHCWWFSPRLQIELYGNRRGV